MNRKELCAGAAAALLLLFSACEMMGPKSGTDADSDGGKAAVRIAIEAYSVQSRTVLPAVGLENVTTWKLWGGKSLESQTLLTDFSSIPATVYLETGAWDFTLKGYEGEDLILQGNITDQTITFEEPNVLSFTVTPLMDGNGTFKITIDLPDGHGITKAKVFTRDESKIDELTPVDNRIVFEDDYAAGDYYFSIRLYKSDDLYGVVSETVQVRTNLRSEKTYTLAAEDLNLTYIITYYLNGGGLDSEVENPGYYRSTDTDITLPVPTRRGYDFEGWYDNAELAGSPVTDITQGSAGDKNFYAKWAIITYTISYVLNEGTNAEEHPTSYTVASPDITLAAPTYTGYTFGGWYGDDGFTEGPVTTISTGSIGNRIFYARWAQSAPVNVSVWVNEDDGAILTILMSDGDITISKTGNLHSESFIATVTDGYAGVQWYLNSFAIHGNRGAAQSIAINATDYAAGIYILGVRVTKNGASYSTDIRFTVTN
jgi:uncharacterized repeat protein (TIGR02543 family)